MDGALYEMRLRLPDGGEKDVLVTSHRDHLLGGIIVLPIGLHGRGEGQGYLWRIIEIDDSRSTLILEFEGKRPNMKRSG